MSAALRGATQVPTAPWSGGRALRDPIPGVRCRTMGSTWSAAPADGRQDQPAEPSMEPPSSPAPASGVDAPTNCPPLKPGDEGSSDALTLMVAHDGQAGDLDALA
jgi:hypothetical protein